MSVLSTSFDRELQVEGEGEIMTDYRLKWMANQRALEQDPDWAIDNLEYDLRSTDWILEKVRASDDYATLLYGALCNNDFQKQDVMPVLKDQKWSCTFRYAAGIIADMRGNGSYIDWYCSGQEGFVSDEIRNDLKRLGWLIVTVEY